MARWKANSDGSAYWDANDDGPNQVDAPQGYNADGTQQQSGQTQAQPESPDYGPAPDAQGGDSGSGTSFDQYPPLHDFQYYLNPDRYTQGDGGGYLQPDVEPGSYVGRQILPVGPGSESPLPGFPQGPFGQPTYVQGSTQPDGGIAYIPPGGTTWQQQAEPAPTAPAVPPQGGYQYMEGVDTGKLNDPSHTTPKYVASRILASGGSLADAAAAIGAKVIDAERMQLPTGEMIDTRRDATGANGQPGANQLQWLVMGDGSGSQTGTPGMTGQSTNLPYGAQTLSGGTGSFGGGLSGSAFSQGGYGGQIGESSASQFAGVPYGGRGDTLWNTLMTRAGQNIIPSEKDPIIAGQVNAFRAEQDRSTRNQIDALAESGGPLNNLNQERRLLNEKASQATGQLQSQVMQNELTARRQEVQAALNGAMGLLTEEQRMALQRELSYLDAGLQQQRISNQNSQFLDQFGLDVTDRANYWDSIRSGLI